MCRPVAQVRVRFVDANLGFAHDTSPTILTCAAHESPVPQVRVRSVDPNLGFAHDTSPTIFDMCRPGPQVRVRSVDSNVGFAHGPSPTIFDLSRTRKPGAPGSRPFCGR